MASKKSNKKPPRGASTSDKKPASPILTTKLFIPPLRPSFVSRPRLFKPLNEGLKRRLTLLSAPAGYGKTSLLCEWIHHHRIPTAWFSIDQDDNDPSRFLTYFVSALQGVGDRIGQVSLDIMQSPQPPPVESILINIINDIVPIPEEFVLVLDDYHLVDLKGIQDMVWFLLERMPPQMHMVIAARSDPPLPLARLRSQNQMTEIRASDLSFTKDEASIFFKEKLKYDLSSSDIELLESRTEGWIAGLQMAALSMQSRDDKSKFIQDFRGDNRYIVDYLGEEVLSHQPQHIQEFLLQTSLLDPLSGALCDAVTQGKGGQKILDTLERADIFIFPLDNERKWFRIHRLFADLLQQRLYHEQGDMVQEFHYRAYDWYLHNGHKEEALTHILAAQDYNRAAELLENIAETVWDRGQQARLLRWFSALPDEQISSRVQLCLLYARALNISGYQEAAEKWLQSGETLLESGPDGFSVTALKDSTRLLKLGKAELQGRIAVIRAFIAAYRGEMLCVMQHTRQAMMSLHEKDVMWRSVAATTLGFVHGWSGDGDLMSARYAFSEAEKISQEAGNEYFYLFASSCLAGIDGLQGRLSKAEEKYRNLLEFADEIGMTQTSLTGSIYTSLGAILYEKNDFDEGMRCIEKGVRLAETAHDIVILAANRLQLARALFLNGDSDGALKLVSAIEKVHSEYGIPPWIFHVATAMKAEIWLAAGNLKTVFRWVKERELSMDDELSNRREPEHTALARFLMLKGQNKEANQLLSRLIESARSGTRIFSLIRLRLLRALVFSSQGSEDLALHEMYRALYLAEPGGFIRTFLAEGSPAADLLERVYQQKRTKITESESDFSQSYVQKILAAFKAHTSISSPYDLIDPLSPRELDVLRLIAAGMSNQEIAEKLFISVNTVRTHTKSINLKLDVHNRTQAVASAKKLGVL